MEENVEISIESIISNRSKKDISSNDANSNSNDYCDFEYNIDEILKSKNWVNENNINISTDKNDNNNSDNNKDGIDCINYFKNNKIGQIKRVISFKDDINKKEILNSNLLNKNNSKSDKSIIFNNLENNKNYSFIKGDKKIIENDEKEQLNKNSIKKKSISSGILTEIELDRSKNIEKEDNDIKESISQEIQNQDNINDSSINNRNNEIINISNISNSNSNAPFDELYNELENELEKIKNDKNSKSKISEKNKNLLELLLKMNEIIKRISKKEEKYEFIFKEILNKINYYVNNKNNYEIINLITEIEEKQKLNISLKKEYQKIINNKPYKDKSKLNERKKIEYKEQLSLYDEINNKIMKMEKILNNLTKKLKIYKQKDNENNTIENFDENKIKKDLELYDNTIKKLKEEINEKENELSILNKSLI